MGKIRTRLIGDTEVEEKQKQKAKERAARKKAEEVKAEEEVVQEAQDEVAVAEVKEAKEVKKEKKVMKKKSAKPEKTVKKRGAKYIKAQQKVEKDKVYPLNEAILLLKELAYTSFDASVELHVNVLEMGLRGEVTMPHGTGRSVRVAIVDDAVLSHIEKGEIDFDVLIAHPSNMSKLAKYAKVLGPKGLMPNPKSGTIGPEPEKLAEKFQKGAVRWKSEPKFPLIHQMIGKVSLKPEQIHENAKSFLMAVGLKNIAKIHIKTTMSPALQVDLQSI